MGYLLAAVLGALVAVGGRFAVHRRRLARYRGRTRPEQSFRRYQGLIVTDDRGTTEVDEVIVIPAGVFVIEEKDFGAWIYGGAKDEYWTAVYANGERHRFQNPERQNYRHMKALEAFLRVPLSVFSSVVVFSPRARFMTEVPPKVLVSDHVDLVREYSDVVLTPEEFDRICARLDTLKASSDSGALDRHVEQLHERFDNSKQCPRCDGFLVRRVSKKPGYEGNMFLGCSNFPKCRFIQNLYGD